MSNKTDKPVWRLAVERMFKKMVGFMLDKQEKPVWRLNTGNGVPDDLGDSVILASGEFRNTWCGDLRGDRWSLLITGQDIYAYQTNRTRKAKYRK